MKHTIPFFQIFKKIQERFISSHEEVLVLHFYIFRSVEMAGNMVVLWLGENK